MRVLLLLLLLLLNIEYTSYEVAVVWSVLGRYVLSN